MISLICTLEAYRIDWLTQFVAHYRGQGVERFLLTLQQEPDLDADESARQRAHFSQTLLQLGIDPPFFWQHAWNGPSMGIYHQQLQAAHTSPGDWIVWTDSDEFQIYPQPLSEIIAQCEAHDVDYIRGVFIDRVATDGSLPAFDPRNSIWDTFRRTTNVSAELAHADPRKVAIARSNIKVTGGKHQPLQKNELRTISGWVQVHHFKWDASLIERLRRRVSPEWRANFPWWKESQRLLDYFAANDNRFAVADLHDVTLSGAHFMAIGD